MQVEEKVDVYFLSRLVYLLWLSQFQTCPSPPPGHLSGFVIFVWKSCKCPTVGLGGSFKTPTQRFKKSANAYPGTIPKFHFPAIKLQMPHLWESVKI